MDIDSQAAAAERALQELRQALQASAPRGKNVDKRAETLKQVSTCERLAQHVKNSLDSYRLETRSLSKDEQVSHGGRLRSLEEGLKQCRAQIEWKRLDTESASASGGGAAGAAGEGAEGPMSLEQAQALAEQTQNESKASVARSMKAVLQAEQIGSQSLVRMHEQEEQMDRIAEDMEDIKANIVRSRKLVGQIARSAASDRCIQFLCAAITIVIMIMIVLAATGRDGGNFAVPDQVREVGRG
mmetsp:Transcript_125013/g.278950  ORF Transcript_125013/g.278950 Transcript_125013/m.278950 type:complete len:242 (+) Transcript_125013:94-819(+)